MAEWTPSDAHQALLDDAYELGRLAFGAGLELSDNPYKAFTDEADQWQLGYTEAREEPHD